MATRWRDSNNTRKPGLFKCTVMHKAQEAMDFLASALEASTE
jgi:hypothetical protein